LSAWTGEIGAGGCFNEVKDLLGTLHGGSSLKKKELDISTGCGCWGAILLLAVEREPARP